jgi:hypothetical protein
MENSGRYAAILTQVFRKLSIQQQALRSLKMRSICDEAIAKYSVLAGSEQIFAS